MVHLRRPTKSTSQECNKPVHFKWKSSQLPWLNQWIYHHISKRMFSSVQDILRNPQLNYLWPSSIWVNSWLVGKKKKKKKKNKVRSLNNFTLYRAIRHENIFKSVSYTCNNGSWIHDLTLHPIGGGSNNWAIAHCYHENHVTQLNQESPIFSFLPSQLAMFSITLQSFNEYIQF